MVDCVVCEWWFKKICCFSFLGVGIFRVLGFWGLLVEMECWGNDVSFFVGVIGLWVLMMKFNVEG